MHATLRKGLREYEFRVPSGPGDDLLRFTSAAQAQLFLHGFFGDDRSMQLFRRLLCGRAGRDLCLAWSERDVLAELARWLVHGKLGVAHRRLPVMASVIPVEEPKPAEIPFAPRAKPIPRPEPQREPPPPKPDLAGQVATLETAAEQGIPLCEECTNKTSSPAPPPPPGPDPQRQVDTLKKAAADGTAFCEECISKPAKQARGRA